MEKQRTLTQNRAMHKYFQEVSNLLNESGIAMSVFYKNIEADYTPESIKALWRSFARTKYNKTSTADLTSKQINEIYDEVNRHIGQFGLHIPFPSYELTNNYLQGYEE